MARGSPLVRVLHSGDPSRSVVRWLPVQSTPTGRGKPLPNVPPIAGMAIEAAGDPGDPGATEPSAEDGWAWATRVGVVLPLP